MDIEKPIKQFEISDLDDESIANVSQILEDTDEEDLDNISLSNSESQ